MRAGPKLGGRRLGDVAGLRALRDRLRGVGALDTAEGVAQRERFLAGKLDDEIRASQDGELIRLADIAKSFDPNRDAASLAVVRMLESSARSRLARVARDPVEQARLAVDALEKADKLWPACGAKDDLDALLVEVAVLRVVAKAPDLAPNAARRRRELGVSMFLYRMLEEKAEPLLSQLRAEPELARALSLRKDITKEQANGFDLLPGRPTSDARPRGPRSAP